MEGRKAPAHKSTAIIICTFCEVAEGEWMPWRGLIRSEVRGGDGRVKCEGTRGSDVMLWDILMTILR